MGEKGMVAITGASGLVGTALQERLRGDGYELCVLSRGRKRGVSGAKEIVWDPAGGTVEEGGLEGARAVVHLAGENIAGGRWTAAFKERVRKSRTDGTGTIARAVAAMASPPEVLVCASAIGWYGDTGDAVVTEEAPPDPGYLGKVCQEWEAAADPAREAGIRVVHLRIGVVLDRAGGALAKMYWPFWFGGGGVVGSGDQWMSWVDLHDVVGAVVFAIETPELAGPANTVAPHPETNRAFTKKLGKAMGRPTIFPLPAFVVRTVFGEMGESLLLGSTRVKPAVLEEKGFEWRYPDLESSLKRALA